LGLPCLLAGCLIQRPPVPPEFLDVRYEVSDSVAVAAAALLRGDAAAQQVVRERLPDYAAEGQVDTLIARLEADPVVAPLGLKVRQIVQDALARASGRVRGALPHPDAQRQLVEAIVLGLGVAVRRTEDASSAERGGGGAATRPPD
jgi:hypothetical protein